MYFSFFHDQVFKKHQHIQNELNINFFNAYVIVNCYQFCFICSRFITRSVFAEIGVKRGGPHPVSNNIFLHGKIEVCMTYYENQKKNQKIFHFSQPARDFQYSLYQTSSFTWNLEGALPFQTQYVNEFDTILANKCCILHI